MSVQLTDIACCSGRGNYHPEIAFRGLLGASQHVLLAMIDT